MAIFSKFLRRLFNNGSPSSVNSNDSGCDVNFGIKQFIECRTGNIVEALFLGVSLEDAVVQFEDGKTVSRKSIASTSSSSSSSSDSSDGNDENVTDHIDAPNCIIERKGAKVMEVNMGSFCHGFGLRENDIILTVNEKPVESADIAICQMERIIARNKNSRLALEIQRKERGFIKLDNGGDDLESVDDDMLHSLPWKDNHTVIRIKNLHYGKYLTVTHNKICLSGFRTKPFSTLFKVHQYAKFLETEASVSKYAVIQHKKTGKCLWVQDGKLSLMDAPKASVTKLPQDSGYLFKIKKLSPSSPKYKDALFFDTVTQSTDNAIGFRSKKRSAELFNNTNKKVLFTTYLHTT